MTRLVLLDRDGVLNVDRADYVKHPGELVLLPGAAAAVARLNAAGYRVAVCTNQSAIGRGIFDEAMLRRLQAWLTDRSPANDALIALVSSRLPSP